MEATGQVDIVAALHTMEVDTEGVDTKGVAMVEVDTEGIRDTESPIS
jgi:Pyruvate/2-oxoacid:ferredoxin oxidoreductase gamma subunit